MKNLWKIVLGFFGGILAILGIGASAQKKEEVKKLDKAIKVKETETKELEKQVTALESKKKVNKKEVASLKRKVTTTKKQIVEAKKNLNIHILNIIWSSKYKSAGVNATPIKHIPPKTPNSVAKDDNTFNVNKFLTFRKSIINVKPHIHKLELNNMQEMILSAPE